MAKKVDPKDILKFIRTESLDKLQGMFDEGSPFHAHVTHSSAITNSNLWTIEKDAENLEKSRRDFQEGRDLHNEKRAKDACKNHEIWKSCAREIWEKKRKWGAITVAEKISKEAQRISEEIQNGKQIPLEKQIPPGSPETIRKVIKTEKPIE